MLLFCDKYFSIYQTGKFCLKTQVIVMSCILFFPPPSPIRPLQDLGIWLTWRVLYKKQELLSLCRLLASPLISWYISCFSSFYLSGVFLACFDCPRCVPCSQCCPFLWIVHSWLPLLYTLTIIYLYVSSVLPCLSWLWYFELSHLFGVR